MNTSARVTMRRRAHILLLAADGLSSTAIAQELGCTRKTVLTWRQRYRTRGMAGLADDPRSGRPSTVGDVLVMLPTLGGRLRDGGGRVPWSARGLATHIGISPHSVLRVWRRWEVSDEIPQTLPASPPLPVTATALKGLYVSGASMIVALDDDGAGAGADAWEMLLRAVATHTARNDPWGMAGNQAEFRSFVERLLPGRQRPVHLLTFEPESVALHAGGYVPNVVVHVAAAETRRSDLLGVLCAMALAEGDEPSPVEEATRIVTQLETVVARWGRSAKPFVWHR